MRQRQRKAQPQNLPPAKRQKGIAFPGVCVIFFCHDGQGKFVMARRSGQARDEQERWDIGGGGLELHATVEDTVKQEIMEEYGTTVQAIEFLGYRDVHRSPGGVSTHWIALDFKVLVDPRAVSIQEPHKFTDLRWFTIEDLPPFESLHSQLPVFLDQYRDRLA